MKKFKIFTEQQTGMRILFKPSLFNLKIYVKEEKRLSLRT